MSSPKDTTEAGTGGTPHEPWFDAAARATRARFDGHSSREQETEWSLMRQQHLRRRVRRAWWPLPLVALVGVSAAWADEMRGGLGWLTLEVKAWLQPQDTSEVTAPSEVPPVTPAPRSKQEVAPRTEDAVALPVSSGVSNGSDVAAPSALSVSSSDAQAPRAASAVRSVNLQPSAPPLAAPPTTTIEPAFPPSSPSSDLALYRSAHHAHFVEHDWAAALRGWDAYLADAQRGQFVPEARYNRAVALAALGRDSEAIEAFTPFAQGIYGNYRAAEAKARIEQLSGADKLP